MIVRVLDPGQVRFPAAGGHAEPFAAYRGLLHSYHRAINGGLTDEDFCALVRQLDERIASVDGHGFRRTPLGAMSSSATRSASARPAGSG